MLAHMQQHSILLPVAVRREGMCPRTCSGTHCVSSDSPWRAGTCLRACSGTRRVFTSLSESLEERTRAWTHAAMQRRHTLCVRSASTQRAGVRLHTCQCGTVRQYALCVSAALPRRELAYACAHAAPHARVIYAFAAFTSAATHTVIRRVSVSLPLG